MKIAKILFTISFIFIQVSAIAQSVTEENVKLTNKQVRALQSLNSQQSDPLNKLKQRSLKTLRLNISELKDNQGGVYLGAVVNRAELSVYLHQLSQLLGDDFQQYRAFQEARDHQLFHMTLLSPPEYQLADKALIKKLLSLQESKQLNITLLGLGKVERDDKKTYFVVAQSHDGQLIRQRFLLKNKDFHITLGFNPSDIYGVKKNSSTLID